MGKQAKRKQQHRPQKTAKTLTTLGYPSTAILRAPPLPDDRPPPSR